ncbi:hypothetical protein EWB00_005615, partial [Schistosoma japonicum]
MTESPFCSTQGRKVVGTTAAPSFLNNRENICATNISEDCLNSSSTTFQSNVNSCKSKFDTSTDDDHISRKLSANGVHALRDNSFPDASPEQEIHSTYSLHQHCKSTYIEIKEPINGDNRSRLRQIRRREVTRCWSRERITRSETILSIRPPLSKQNDGNVEENNLLKSDSISESSSSLPSIIRHIPVQLTNNIPVYVQRTNNDTIQQIPIFNQLPEVTKNDTNKVQNLSFSNIEYSEYTE